MVKEASKQAESLRSSNYFIKSGSEVSRPDWDALHGYPKGNPSVKKFDQYDFTFCTQCKTSLRLCLHNPHLRLGPDLYRSYVKTYASGIEAKARELGVWSDLNVSPIEAVKPIGAVTIVQEVAETNQSTTILNVIIDDTEAAVSLEPASDESDFAARIQPDPDPTEVLSTKSVNIKKAVKEDVPTPVLISLSPEDQMEVVRLYDDGYGQKGLEIAAKFKIKPNEVSAILRANGVEVKRGRKPPRA